MGRESETGRYIGRLVDSPFGYIHLWHKSSKVRRLIGLTFVPWFKCQTYVGQKARALRVCYKHCQRIQWIISKTKSYVPTQNFSAICWLNSLWGTALPQRWQRTNSALFSHSSRKWSFHPDISTTCLKNQLPLNRPTMD